MIDAFASVGATHFVVSWTNSGGQPRRPRTLRNALQRHACTTPTSPHNEDWLDAVSIKNISRAEITHTMRALLDTAASNRLNLIVRPRGDNAWFIQLDDLSADQIARTAPAVFLSLETSPGNFQAWVALRQPEDPEFSRRVKTGVGGSDKTASGATRIAGSANFKEKYAPSFPVVMLRTVQPGRIVTRDDLDQLGLVAAPEPIAPSPPRRPPLPRTRPGANVRKWPSWDLCLERAPPSQSRPGQVRESIADFTWSLIAASWGWSRDEIARQLMLVSPKARENGEAYAMKTATRAAEAAERNAAQGGDRRQMGKIHATDYGRR
jgi:hypothetical protein